MTDRLPPTPKPMPSTMRAARFHEHGGPEVLRLDELPQPDPAPGEARVAVRAAGLNHLDLWVRRGLPIDTTLPHTGGSDITGVVDAVGAEVRDDWVGERVVVNPSLWCGRCAACGRGEHPLCRKYRIIGEHTDGGFAEYVVVPAEKLYRIPESLSFEEASVLPVSYGTAWRALSGRAGVRAGESVLVLGASGGTAIAALQLAAHAGAEVYAVTSGPENVRRVRELGARRVYDRLEEDWSRLVYEDTDREGVDVVVENVGEATWDKSIRALARGGRLVTYGATTGHRAGLDLRLLFWKQLHIIGSTMAARREFEEMLRMMGSGAVRPVIDRVLPLEEIAAAHERLESGEAFGSIVLTP